MFALALAAMADNCIVTSSEFGAACDGSTDDSASIQNALTTCAGAGRTVVFPAGRTCLSQPLRLSDHADVFLETGAVVKAGRKWNNTAFVSADDAQNITIRGNGTIDGSGAQWWTGRRSGPRGR